MFLLLAALSVIALPAPSNDIDVPTSFGPEDYQEVLNAKTDAVLNAQVEYKANKCGFFRNNLAWKHPCRRIKKELQAAKKALYQAKKEFDLDISKWQKFKAFFGYYPTEKALPYPDQEPLELLSRKENSLPRVGWLGLFENKLEGQSNNFDYAIEKALLSDAKYDRFGDLYSRGDIDSHPIDIDEEN